MRTPGARLAIAWRAGMLAMAAMLIGGCAAGGRGISQPKGIDDYLAGAQAYRAGDRAGTVAAMETAIQTNPKLIMPRVVLGGVYRADGDYQKASGQYETLVVLDPYTVENHYYLGVCYQFLQRLKESAASYLHALQLDPDDFGSNMNLGLVYLALGQTDEAVRYTRRAAAINPNSAAAYANLAVALDAQGDYAQAEIAYRKSLELDSSQATTLSNFGSNLIMQGKPAEAARTLALALEKADSPWARKRHGDALMMLQQYQDAAREYIAALDLNPDYYPAMNELGRALAAQYKQGMQLDDQQRKSAVALWRRSLELKPDQPQIEALVKEWGEGKLFAE